MDAGWCRCAAEGGGEEGAVVWALWEEDLLHELNDAVMASISKSGSTGSSMGGNGFPIPVNGSLRSWSAPLQAEDRGWRDRKGKKGLTDVSTNQKGHALTNAQTDV
jgi:hypothetical protein